MSYFPEDLARQAVIDAAQRRLRVQSDDTGRFWLLSFDGKFVRSVKRTGSLTVDHTQLKREVLDLFRMSEPPP